MPERSPTRSSHRRSGTKEDGREHCICEGWRPISATGDAGAVLRHEDRQMVRRSLVRRSRTRSVVEGVVSLRPNAAQGLRLYPTVEERDHRSVEGPSDSFMVGQILMAQTQDQTISLASPDSFSSPIEIRGAVRASIAITEATGSIWGNAVVEIQFSIDPDRERWSSFTPEITMTDTVRSKPRIPTAGLAAIRLRTTTPGGFADAAAIYDWSITMPDGTVVYPT